MSPENIPGNIRLHFPVLVEETNFSCVVVFQFTSNEFGFSVGSARSIVAVGYIGNGDVADYRPDAPTHEDSPFLFFPCLLYRVSFDQLHKFAV